MKNIVLYKGDCKMYKSRCRENGTRALARKFKVSQAHISFIVNNKERIKNEHI